MVCMHARLRSRVQRVLRPPHSRSSLSPSVLRRPSASYRQPAARQGRARAPIPGSGYCIACMPGNPRVRPPGHHAYTRARGCNRSAGDRSDGDLPGPGTPAVVRRCRRAANRAPGR
ncbi:hypothetical protein BDA96_01G163400 [Sorghum bicolor]|uniref:Uncharacterized protein n=1 Tax=Sorghum bicolor TaxID=4558 RepID=A0A921UXU3_SORBI|nr:hypothetical protein BDA96_01G163400 [Sorghum bicolor]